ncbi:MAG: UDP-N-acetylmuramoyl-L-alanyl-D-glutamate--2,6-diaminopimelate ligase [Clostridia bacterium]|nr:UDP-N-acetylmuramoyl-L-alanyl-D-glutamate--2,6-diaminopimelate ligase [Clostridia bacterium]
MRGDQVVSDAVQTTGEAEKTSIEHLTIDSRQCRKGSLYFAIPGTRVDGHDFVAEAYARGAAAAVVERPVDCPIPQFIVQNTRASMALAAANFYACPASKLTLIAVTGTNGKTSVTFMIRAIARSCGIPCGVIGTGGIFAGEEKLPIAILTSTTPDPIELQYALAEMVKRGIKWVVMEATAHALDLDKLVGMRFASVGFTNLTQDHLDYFQTMERYGAAKKKLFSSSLACSGAVNIQDAFSAELLREADIPLLTYALEKPADLTARDIAPGTAETTFTLETEGKRLPVRLPATGLFNVSNALCAVACCMQAGLSAETCAAGLMRFSSVPGRFEAVPTGNRGFSVIVDYAHTPDGLQNVLSAIRQFKRGRLICVFGCGGNRDAAKRPIMGETAGNAADFCVLTSDNPRFEEPEDILDAIEEGIRRTACPYARQADRRKALALALDMACPGDVVAVCGKGDEDYQEIRGVKHRFSDREEILTLLRS